LQINGLVLGAGLGFWTALGFPIGYKANGEKKNVLALFTFVLIAVIGGLLYLLAWQLAYINSRHGAACLVAQIFGMILGTLCSAIILFYQEVSSSGGVL
jgi:uncharacterized membrane protein